MAGRLRAPAAVLAVGGLLGLLAGCNGVALPWAKGTKAPPTAAGAAPAQAAAQTADPMLSLDPPAQPERLAYSPPAGAPGGPLDQAVAAPPNTVFDGIQRALRRAGLKISHLDERAGIIAAVQTGDPGLFVDCGTIAAEATAGRRTLFGGGGGATTRQLEAAAQTIAFRRGAAGQTRLISRELILNARVVYQVRPEGSGSRLRSMATYVLSKRTTPAGGSGTVETIAFASGGQGGFAKGTVCQPTGSLERLALVAASS